MKIALFNNSESPDRPAFAGMLPLGQPLVVLRCWACCGPVNYYECASNEHQLATGYGWIIHESNLDFIGEL